MKEVLLVAVALIAVPFAIATWEHLRWLAARRRARREWWRSVEEYRSTRDLRR